MYYRIEYTVAIWLRYDVKILKPFYTKIDMPIFDSFPNSNAFTNHQCVKQMPL